MSPNSAGGLFDGDRLQLSRAISAVENDHETAAEIMNNVAGHIGQALLVGVTGPPGAGKSTLTGALIGALRDRQMTVAVIAVDPSSPLTGGAILGDRIRMTKYSNDEGVFVRSLASRGSAGGLSRATSKVAHIMDAAGFDIVLIETVGAGQSEVEIMEYADVTLVVSAPGLGDEIQALKAGILEIADILVVNKADLAGADITVQQLKGTGALGRTDKHAVRVMKTIATLSQGVDALTEEILRLGAVKTAKASPPLDAQRARSLLASNASDLVRKRLRLDDSAEFDQLAEKLAAGEITLDEATEQAIHLAGAPGKKTDA